MTPECTHQESSPLMAEFQCIWVSTYGLGSHGRVGCSGGLIAEGNGVGYTRGCMVGTVFPVGSPGGTESSLMGLSAGFHLLGHFRGPIPSA